MRRIVGNLDFETSLAIAHAESKRASSSSEGRAAPPTILPAVMETISSLATLLRVLGDEKDHLWIPCPIDPARVLEVPGLPRPLLESGPFDALRPAGSLLAWGETAQIEAWRAAGRRMNPTSERARSSPPGGASADWLWSCPPASPQAAATVNHRSFCLELAQRLGRALPGARMLHSLTELEGHLRDGGAATSPSGEWILKAPYSAAGRERLRGRGRSLESDAARNRAANLFAHHLTLLFEPWLERVEDFGCCALLDERECRIISVHRQEVDGYGRLKNLELCADPAELRVTTEAELAAIRTVAEQVGDALRGAGYRGPFGIDSWRYRDADGKLRFHALGEINARMSFGFVARVLADRLLAALTITKDARLTLRFGAMRRAQQAPTGRVIPLVSSGARHTGGAWLEILEPSVGGA